MFEGCSKLKSIDISELNTNLIKTYTYMFKGCEELTTINF